MTILYFFLNELGLSQRHLADLLGVTSSTMSRVLKGQRPLPLEAETRLAQLYAVAMSLKQAPAAELLQQQEHAQAQEWLKQMKEARQIWRQLQRKRMEAERTLVQASRLQLWLQAMDLHEELVPTPKQQRCMEDIRYRQSRYQARGRKNLMRLQQMLHDTESRMAMLRSRFESPLLPAEGDDGVNMG